MGCGVHRARPGQIGFLACARCILPSARKTPRILRAHGPLKSRHLPGPVSARTLRTHSGALAVAGRLGAGRQRMAWWWKGCSRR